MVRRQAASPAPPGTDTKLVPSESPPDRSQPACGGQPKLVAIGIAPLGIISIGIVPMGVVSIGVLPRGS